MEDNRTQHPLLQVETVDTSQLPDLLQARPSLQVVLTNSMRDLRGPSLEPVAALPNAWVEISMLEGVEGISNLLRHVPVERVLFGSHLPLFILESALLKLQESDLTPAQIDAMTHENADRLLKG